MFERAGKNADIYITCSLQPWVSEGRVIRQSLGTTNQAEDDLQLMLDQRDLTLAKRHAPSIPSQLPKQPKDRRGALARLSILPQKGSTDEILYEAGAFVQDSSQTPELVSLGATVDVAVSSPLDVDQLRLQYFETLYLSKTSLGYFSKGPLARARTMVQQEKLINFYQESIITTKKLDLKYKESVNKIIESAISSQQAAEPAAEASRKASRKKKMGKNALYPAEEEYVRRCWLEREIRHSKSVTAQSQAQDQRKLVCELRTRETKMQILLILELLALEAGSSKPDESTKATDVAIKTEQQSDNTAAVLAKTPIKTKPSPKYYSSDIETLADRLCIWHTVGIDDTLDSPDKDPEARKSSNSKDQLGDFCTEAIIPFYASRLPEQCKMICRKLGGPEISSQASKTASMKPASTIRVPPGAAIQRRSKAVPKKTLERVLSDDLSMRHASPPVLTRSATAPLVANIKREPSETFQRPASRGTLHKSVSFTNREIDLHADARLQEAKRRKLARVAEQKKELDAAIAALKKPNRTAAAQTLMDEVESRNLDTTRKHPVHITATPRRPKSGASVRHEPDLPPVCELNTSTDDHMIPSSTARPSRSGRWQPPASAKKQAVLFAVHETPVRISSAEQNISKPVSRLNFQSTTKSDNISSDPTLVESTPATNRLRPDLLTQVQNTPMRMTKSMRPVSLTPLKKTEVRVEDVFRDAPIIPAGAGTAMDRVMGGGSTELSVYDALGWNDDYDL